MNQEIAKIAKCCLGGRAIDTDQIHALFAEALSSFSDLLYWANRIRERFFGNKVKVCSIVPGRLGGCNQDCKFCAQSARYKTGYGQAQPTSDEDILMAAEQARASGVTHFGIVYSGRTTSETELERLEGIIRQIRTRWGLDICASVGMITEEQAKGLAEAGLTGYNHNLETSARHFADIVTTHRYEDRVRTIQAAQDAGLRVCAGGIFGIGEWIWRWSFAGSVWTRCP